MSKCRDLWQFEFIFIAHKKYELTTNQKKKNSLLLWPDKSEVMCTLRMEQQASKRPTKPILMIIITTILIKRDFSIFFRRYAAAHLVFSGRKKAHNYI